MKNLIDLSKMLESKLCVETNAFTAELLKERLKEVNRKIERELEVVDL